MQQDVEKTLQWVKEKIEYDELEFYINDNYELCFLVKEYQSIL